MAGLDELLDEERVASLHHHWITTVEDLVGALESDAGSVGTLLRLSPRDLARLRRRARAALEPETRDHIDRERRAERQYGAWDPSE